MKSIQHIVWFSICCLISACVTVQIGNNYSESITITHAKKQPLTKNEIQHWHFKNIFNDTIPGISLDKTYKKLLKDKKCDTIVIAVIDTELDIDHPDLKNQIWTNTDEVPNNGLDDDNNGYIDDMHGWNFLQTMIGGDIQYSKYEFIRVIERDEKEFINKTLESIPKNLKKRFKEYKRAIRTYEKEKEYVMNDIETYRRIKYKFIEADSLLKKYFPTKNYTISQLDSLATEISDSVLKVRVSYMKYYLKNGIDVEWTNNGIKEEKKKLATILNFNYNDRKNQRDNIDNLSDRDYGNNNIQGTKKGNHGTKVVSILAATRNNNLGIDGVTNTVKVMFLGVAPFGNEHDKDITLAIRYAVDNGAKIINMSIGKEFSTHPEWIKEALLYAQSKDVLVVSSAGNKSYNLDTEFDFPDDYDDKGEYVDNFIKVGASSYKADSTLVWLSSNYSVKNVDVFAPGHKIHCLTRDGWHNSSGTSFASAIVTGIAALIRSYYPNLSSIEVKEIILKSGISFDVNVIKPYPYGEKQPEERIPFQLMSKSGKIVNAYNALLMAEEVSKKKKRKKRTN
ncbi:S8 family serine peptidase [Kordia zhangzhouensis]|uniref:S8 family serine peptidase n=1 Tax=Kordia zhangzhouensis TaxID=1620405 RepID=UPI000629A5E8|nr:S8 family serine peptidase [Kordia zhangzhouensis]